ncbi:MAG: Holliday junction resolvase RuvX [Clostridia bacterium]|nr:Holliday junction resolvase RuvX [Clostridia bacterium]
MIIMSVDYGDARTGLAVSDKTEFLASAAGLIARPGFKKIAAEVARRAGELGAELIVVGDPVNMDGTEGPRSQKCRDFAREVEAASGIPTVTFDERLTSVSAHEILSASGMKMKKQKKHVDELAAVIILESFLEERKRAAKGEGE